MCLKNNEFGCRAYLTKCLTASAAIIIVLFTHNALADGSVDQQKIKNTFTAACKNTIQTAVSKLSPALSKYPETYKQDQNLVIFIPFANFNAFADYQARRIEIPAMMCIETWYALDAIGQLYFNPDLKPKVAAYFKYLNDRKQQGIRSGVFENIPLETFYNYAHIPPIDSNSENGKKLHAILENQMVSAMAFLIGHEAGHLVHKDKPYGEISNADSQRQENAADFFSINLLNDSGISLIPALSILDRFLYAEIQYDKGASTSTHPSSECRIALLMDSSSDIQEMLQDKNRRQEFASRTGMTTSAFATYISEEKRKCQN